mmetsp:Transcript_1492/g.3467  ORF Transcript_1492/g.3467 Transcript_1492/m.3467 type:complete len:226 (-) Transcript_1492:34-711(-)
MDRKFRSMSIANFVKFLRYSDCFKNKFNRVSPPKNAFSIDAQSTSSDIDLSIDRREPHPPRSIQVVKDDLDLERIRKSGGSLDDQSDVSALTTFASSSFSINREEAIVDLTDEVEECFDKEHLLRPNAEWECYGRPEWSCTNEPIQGTRRVRGICQVCRRQTMWHCPTCAPLDGSKKAWYCLNSANCTRFHKQKVEKEFIEDLYIEDKETNRTRSVSLCSSSISS